MLDDTTIIQRKKKPRGGELTPAANAHNRLLWSINIRIERAIDGVKRDRMVKDKRRLLKTRMRDAIMEMCCGLDNFRIQYCPWNYAT